MAAGFLTDEQAAQEKESEMSPGTFSSNTSGVPAVTADNTAPTGPISNGVHALTSSPGDSAVYGEHRGTGIGIFGRGGPSGGEGVFGQTNSGSSGVFGNNTNTLDSPKHYVATSTNPGLTGESASGTGVVGLSGLAGVPKFGREFDPGGTGVVGANNQFAGSGVSGQANGERGVGVSGQANGFDGIGVYSEANGETGVGVFSRGRHTGVEGNSNGTGVVGEGDAVGVYAHNPSAGITGHDAYLASGCCAGDFHGNVAVLGKIQKFGGGFLLDHPLDAAGKYLSHSFVESSDMKNIYDGIAVLDAEGEADVELPSWFDTLNGDLRYQLTCIGAYAPVYVAQEVTGNRFRIGGGATGMRVSWQVTGIRQDPWAVANRVPVEEEKPADEQGYFLDPGLYGEPDERHIRHVRYADQVQQRKRVEDLARVRRWDV